jgi:hypothetical protein
MSKSSVTPTELREHVRRSQHCGRPKTGRPQTASKETKCPRCGKDYAKGSLKKHHAKTFSRNDPSLRHLNPSGQFWTTPYKRKLCPNIAEDAGMHVSLGCWLL